MTAMHFCRTETRCTMTRGAKGFVVQLDATVEKPHEDAVVRFIDWPRDPHIAGVEVTWMWEE